ncbi:MAG TPA: enolase C-terminal domain-like protein [Bryobacteraceae bacterium]
MSRYRDRLTRKDLNQSSSSVGRRQWLRIAGATVSAPLISYSRAADQVRPNGARDSKIAELEFTELTGHYEAEAGVNGQPQVNPLDIYDDLRQGEYRDRPGKIERRTIKAIYLRIRNNGGAFGLYGPIDREPALLVLEDLRRFLIGKDALAGEALWDEMYRSNRHSRAGIFLMAISAIDNALWDLRGRYYGVPVYRLLGGPTRDSVEVYASCLGFSLEPDAVRTRCLAIQKEGYRYQKWFFAYGPGSGPEGMRKNVELVRVLRETLGEDTELMFDSFSGWDLSYALEWAHQVEKYRPRWMEESTHPEKLETFATLRRSTTIPVASGEHFYGRWEVERYLQAQALSVVQADPEWCGGISELLKIGTVASLHDVPVIPHGHSIHAALHVVASQSPMTFPLCEYLINKMKTYYHFETHAPTPQRAHLALPQGPGFGIELDEAKIESRVILKAG